MTLWFLYTPLSGYRYSILVRQGEASLFGRLYFQNPMSGISRTVIYTLIKYAKTDQSQFLLEWFKTFYWLNITKAVKISTIKVEKPSNASSKQANRRVCGVSCVTLLDC